MTRQNSPGGDIESLEARVGDRSATFTASGDGVQVMLDRIRREIMEDVNSPDPHVILKLAAKKFTVVLVTNQDLSLLRDMGPPEALGEIVVTFVNQRRFVFKDCFQTSDGGVAENPGTGVTEELTFHYKTFQDQQIAA